MWNQIELTRATYRARPSAATGEPGQPAAVPCAIAVDGAGGSQGWRLTCFLDRETADDAKEDELATFAIRPVSAKTIPQLSESYIRGDDLVLAYAQQKPDPFGLSIQVTPIETSERMTIIQLTISLQTDLLDSHPLIELSAAAAGKPVDAPKSPGTVGPCPLPGMAEPETYGTIILSSRDQPAVEDLSDSESLRVQLFGNFLEKGVIRKCRPWVVVWRGGPPTSIEIEAVYQRLCKTPLPLTT